MKRTAPVTLALALTLTCWISGATHAKQAGTGGSAGTNQPCDTSSAASWDWDSEVDGYGGAIGSLDDELQDLIDLAEGAIEGGMVAKAGVVCGPCWDPDQCQAEAQPFEDFSLEGISVFPDGTVKVAIGYFGEFGIYCSPCM